MASNFDENRVQEILGILKSSAGSPMNAHQQQPEPINKESGNNSFDENRVNEVMNVLRGTSSNDSGQTENEFSWPRFLGEKLAKGALNLADLPQTIAQSTGNPNLNLPEREWTREEIESESKNRPKPIISSGVESLAGKAGIDLHSQGEGNTAFQRIVGKGAEFAGSSLIPGGGLAGLAKNVATGTAIGAGAGGLEEVGVPEPIASLGSLAAVLKGAPALSNAIKKTLNSTSGLSDAEKRVANYLQQVLGEEGLATVNENISKAPSYPLTGYEPATAEVTTNPFISTLHRLRQGIPGTGLQEHAAAQNEAIHKVSDKLSAGAAKSPHVKDVVTEELGARKTKRYEETHPLYEELRKDKTQVEPKNSMQFFDDNKIVKGKKRKDLDAVRKLLEPSEKLTLVEETALKNYESEFNSINNSKMSKASKEQAIAKLKKPKDNHPTVADLDEARQNINDMIGEFERSGQNNRARQLIDFKKSLDKDLEGFALQKEATSKYSELSKPVNEILEHPTLKNIPESRVNNIFDGLFNNKSLDNMRALKQVLKDRPKDWEGIQNATVEYLMKSIKNAGAQGKRNILSSHRLDKFLEQHEAALGEVFTKDQMKFLDELKNALKGRNVAETSGLEKQSATYSKLITGTHLGESVGQKVLKGATYIPHAVPKLGRPVGEALRTMLDRYLKSREGDVMGVLDSFLKNPEYAPKLLNHKFKTQAEFNKEMDSFARQAASVAADSKDKDKR